jgi:hypothetical protein
MSRRFTYAEAQRLIKEVEPLLRRAIALKTEYEDAGRERRQFQEHLMMAGGVVVDRTHALDLKRRADSAGERLKSALEEVQAIGCLVKDLDIGLIDFPTTFRGVEVYLCWRLGEPGIEYWHGVDEGFRGRKPIDQDFLDHHEGDPAN